MILSKLLLAIVGLGAGILVSAGVFTVLLSVGLVPRFAGKTHTGVKIFLYEEMVVFGTLVGCLASVFPGAVIFCREWLQERMNEAEAFGCLVLATEALTGLFAGIFVGCLALAIAEMLDSIPILTRRIGFRHGLGLMVLSIAMGKAVGSLLYFWHPIFVFR